MGRQIPGGISRRITMQNNIFDKPSEMLRSILSKDQLSFCEYRFEEDLLISYGNDLKIQKTIPGYLAHIEADSQVHPDDRWKLKEFFQGKTRGEVEVRLQTDDSLKKLFTLGISAPPSMVPTNRLLKVLLKSKLMVL